MTEDALRRGFWRFSALISTVYTCTFNAAEIMVAIFLHVTVPLALFTLHYLFFLNKFEITS